MASAECRFSRGCLSPFQAPAARVMRWFPEPHFLRRPPRIDEGYQRWGARRNGPHFLSASAPNTEHRTPNTEHRTPNTEHRTPNTEHRTPNTEHRTPNTEHREGRSSKLITTVPAPSRVHRSRSSSVRVQKASPPESAGSAQTEVVDLLADVRTGFRPPAVQDHVSGFGDR